MEDMCIAIYKVISICADGASVMQGKIKGVLTLLLKDIRKSREDRLNTIIKDSPRPRTPSSFSLIRGVIGMHCVCHRFALVLTDAIKVSKIPDIVRLLMRDIYEYVSKGGLRKKNLKAFLQKHNEKRAEARKGTVMDPDDVDALHAVYTKEQEKDANYLERLSLHGG
jgi:hypothetical protein